MQLVAYGAQDIYLTGNPQITFFKVVYRRHTNFSMEAIQQTFNGTVGFGKSVTATISLNGDLVHRMYLEHGVKLTAASADNVYINICSNYGSNLIKDCELEIGGQKIDKHYNHWHSTWSSLTEFNPSGVQTNGIESTSTSEYTPAAGHYKSTLFNTMSGNGGGVTTGIKSAADVSNAELGSWNIVAKTGNAADTAETKIFIPLYFWFCRNPGLALPLIALQYHEVKVKMTFENENNLFCEEAEGGAGKDDRLGNAGTITSQIGQLGSAGAGGEVTNKIFTLWADYIYLDTDERRRFAQVSHEYLIEQLQFQSFSNSASMTLNFNHPVKELIWTKAPLTTFRPTRSAASKTPAEILLEMKNREPDSLAANFQLKLNGHDRFSERDYRYFTRTQVWQHHTGHGSSIKSDAIAVYSFALKPEEHQPSGTCNFSRIDNAQLTAASANYHVYAVNYNVLRIMSGMGGLAYSN